VAYTYILDFLDVEIALRFAQDNLDVKKVSAPSKTPVKWLIMCFSRLKNIKSLTSKNSGTLIVIIIVPNISQIVYLILDRNVPVCKKIYLIELVLLFIFTCFTILYIAVFLDLKVLSNEN
jgi:hypothetical protein